MSDPKRATLITVGAPKSAKNNVKKTVRLTINLDESNESKYSELNYKELVIAEERTKPIENGKTPGLDPYSDNDEDVQRVARKFEQKYGGKSTYGSKGRSKVDDFADIGAGYDESDSFIDNTHGYDEMIPPECDTFHGGFYINCGSLEFKTVPDNQMSASDGEPTSRKNKRRLSSSSSEEESSDSSSESESQEEKDPKAIVNGAIDPHKTEHRKKKNKKVESKKAKKIRRKDSSAATSGKQTSDDNAQGDGESADSRTSHSDSHTSKPAPSSENAVTSDSSRDVEAKVDVHLPALVLQAVEALEAAVGKQLSETPNTTPKELYSKTEPFIIRIERALSKCDAAPSLNRTAWGRAAVALSTTRSKLLQQVKARLDTASNDLDNDPVALAPEPTVKASANTNTATVAPTVTTAPKRKQEDETEEDFSRLTDIEREAKVLETIQRLKTLIDDRKPGMIANYNAECERVQEERKKIQQLSAAEGAPMVEKRLPKRRFPWCGRARALLSRLRRLALVDAANSDAAARLLATRVLPLFPAGFVRMPTLLRQADLSKDLKVSEVKRQRLGSSSQPTIIQSVSPAFSEPIQFPSSLTVTTSTTTTARILSDKQETAPATDDSKYKSNVFNTMLNTYNLNKDLIVEKPEKKETEKIDNMYVPPNNIGSITITPVPNQMKLDKKSSGTNSVNNSSDKVFIRVKSPAALNEMVHKKEKHKKEKTHVKEKSIDTPLHVETNYQSKEVSKKAEISQNLIEKMRVQENNIPRPALVPVQHSPTFAKPDKRPPEAKKKKDIVIVSDVDPLGDNIPEPLAIDDSSSDVEVIEEKTDQSEISSEVPSKDNKNLSKKVMLNSKSNKSVGSKTTVVENKSQDHEETSKDLDVLLRSIREMESSQDPSLKINSNAYSSVITNAMHEKASARGYPRNTIIYPDTQTDRDKFAEPASLRRTDGCNTVSGGNASAVKMIKS